MTQNWLYTGGGTRTGDHTGANVVFFEIPDTTTQTLYFAVRNPDVDVDPTLTNSEPDLPVFPDRPGSITPSSGVREPIRPPPGSI